MTWKVGRRGDARVLTEDSTQWQFMKTPMRRDVARYAYGAQGLEHVDDGTASNSMEMEPKVIGRVHFESRSIRSSRGIHMATSMRPGRPNVPQHRRNDSATRPAVVPSRRPPPFSGSNKVVRVQRERGTATQRRVHFGPSPVDSPAVSPSATPQRVRRCSQNSLVKHVHRHLGLVRPREFGSRTRTGDEVVRQLMDSTLEVTPSAHPVCCSVSIAAS